MHRPLFLAFCAALAGCEPAQPSEPSDPADPIDPPELVETDDPTEPVCLEPEPAPHDESLPAWSYHEDGGAEGWGALPGYELCDLGQQQTPIDISTGSVVTQLMSDSPLAFVNYDQPVEVDLLDNGHTLQVVVASEMSGADPQVTFGGETYYLVQFHYHSTSEHTVDGVGSLFEVHLVHKSLDGELLVVGVMFDEGEADPVIDELLVLDPGHEMQTLCDSTVNLHGLLPEDKGFFHYPGSLTTPGCGEGVQWFVAERRASASAEQAATWQERFHGTTNRPVQPLNERVVVLLVP